MLKVEGAGAKAAIKTISASLKYWDVNRVYTYSFTTLGVKIGEVFDYEVKGE